MHHCSQQLQIAFFWRESFCQDFSKMKGQRAKKLLVEYNGAYAMFKNNILWQWKLYLQIRWDITSITTQPHEQYFFFDIWLY